MLRKASRAVGRVGDFLKVGRQSASSRYWKPKGQRSKSAGRTGHFGASIDERGLFWLRLGRYLTKVKEGVAKNYIDYGMRCGRGPRKQKKQKRLAPNLPLKVKTKPNIRPAREGSGWCLEESYDRVRRGRIDKG